MNRFAKQEDPNRAREAAGSGIRPKFAEDGRGREISGANERVELWELVDFWITQIVPGDSRRRLLELARLRHDARLASEVLRYL